MSQTYTIHKDIIHTIFKKLIDANAFTQKKNAKTALQLIINSLDETAIEGVASLMLKESVYDVLSIGDYVEVEAPVYHVGSEYEEDVLSDMGLLPTKHGYVYGKVIDDTSWSSGKVFNPFYVRIKVNLFYHDDDKKLKEYEHEVSPLSCIKVNKGTISYFKPKKQNQDA